MSDARGVINLRSDTQSLPTSAMRQAMAEAELGDDTYGEDPTVRRLEERVADLVGVEAAMLVLSGTMANLVAVMTHCAHGDEVFLEAGVHVLRSEAGGLSSIAGVVPTIVPSVRGHLTAGELEARIQPRDLLRPRPRLVWLENTHNRAGGTVLGPDAQAEIVDVARRHGLAVHLDGARVPNAAVRLGLPWRDVVAGVDSVYLDFTKGLACPLGAVLAGSEDFIAEARYRRRVLGGGMRQAGVIAACALTALDTVVDRIADDHETASLIASELAASRYYGVDAAAVETNMVVVDVRRLGGANTAAALLKDAGVLVSTRPPHHLRLVTHLQITRASAREAVRRMEQVAASHHESAASAVG
jgi:threonine aldolase